MDGGFELDEAGLFAHVLLAPGHPGLAFPEGLERDERVVHAYEQAVQLTKDQVESSDWSEAPVAGVAVEIEEEHDGARGVVLDYVSPDGEEGYPGTVRVAVTYTLIPNNQLLVEYRATADRARREARRSGPRTAGPASTRRPHPAR